MTEEEKQALKYFKALDKLTFEPYLSILLNLINKQQKEIRELKKVNKMVEIYKSYGIPEDAEMVIMRKDDFLRNCNNEFISKDKIKEFIKKELPDDDIMVTCNNYDINGVLIREKLEELLEE